MPTAHVGAVGIYLGKSCRGWDYGAIAGATRPISLLRYRFEIF